MIPQSISSTVSALARRAIILTTVLTVCHTGILAASAGVVLSSGSNTSGETGQGTNVGNTLVATQIDMSNIVGTAITQVAAGEQFGLLLDNIGTAYSFGHSDFGETGFGVDVNTTLSATPIDTTNLLGKTINQVAAGFDHSLLLANDGTVFSFGGNSFGQTGLGTTVGNTSIATQIDTTNLAGKTITQVSAGGSHSLLLADDGTVFSFGSNLDGATGQGTNVGSTLVATPIDMTNLAGKKISQVSSGVTHNLLLSDDGSVYSFGLNGAGRTGQGTDIGSTIVADLIDTTNLAGKSITAVDAGAGHNLLLADDGTVFSFGFNSSGQAGLGTTTHTLVAEAIDTTNLVGNTITQLASGVSHSLLLSDDGSVFSFGANSDGSTGLGTTIGSTLVATSIDTTNMSGLQVTGISAGTASLFLAVPEPGGMSLLVLAVISMIATRTTRRRWTLIHRQFAITLSICLVSSTVAWAGHKPNHGSGGGKPGGDGGGGELQLVELHPNGGAYAINDGGIVVGSVDRVAGTWNANDEIPTFSPLPGDAAGAQAINGVGEMVGFSRVGSQSQPVYWSSLSAEPTELPLPSGFTRGWANGISSDGVIVGEVDDGQEFSAAVWRVLEGSVFGPFVLGVGGANDVASLANGDNRVVGRLADTSFGHVAMSWDLDLNTDGSINVTSSANLAPGYSAEAFAITDIGDASGIIKWGGGIENTAFMLRDGAVQLLPSGGRNQYGVGYDLNNTDVVGTTALSWMSNQQIATQWDSRDKRHDLTREFFENWTTTVAQGISDDGTMVGYGSGGAWLLRNMPAAATSYVTTVPEPSTLALLILGTTMLATRRRK